eukprot:gene16693-5125_t
MGALTDEIRYRNTNRALLKQQGFSAQCPIVTQMCVNCLSDKSEYQKEMEQSGRASMDCQNCQKLNLDSQNAMIRPTLLLTALDEKVHPHCKADTGVFGKKGIRYFGLQHYNGTGYILILFKTT